MTTLHGLSNAPGARHRKMRVGCGSGSGKGKTCGRGHKGQYARSGHKHKPAFEGGQMRLLRRMPKRGFNRIKRSYALVGLERLNGFAAGSEVNPDVLKQAGLVTDVGDGIKILGDGNLTVKLTVKAHAFSQSARQKIAALGGTVEEIR